jgi:hypothetical protein
MNSNAEEKMNVERPRFLGYRVVAWVILIASCWGVYELLTSPPDEFLSSGGRAGVTAAIAAMACGSLMAIVVSHGVYYAWDDEKIAVSFLGRKRFIRWGEIENVVARLAGAFAIYDLSDVRGQRLRVHMHVLCWQSPLYAVLRDKWAPLVSEDLKKIEASGEAQFPVRVLGLPVGCFIVRGDKLVHKGVSRTREMTLTDVEVVYTRHEHDEWPGARGCELMSRTGERMRISPRTTMHDRLIPYVQSRAKNALWVDLDGPEPTTPAEKAAYLRGNIDYLRKPKAIVLPFASMMLYGGLNLIFPVDWIEAVWGGLLFVAGLAGLIWWFAGGRARQVRRLRKRLSSVEAGAKTEEPEAALGEENRG